MFDKIVFGAKTALPNEDYSLPWHPIPKSDVYLGINNGKIAAIGGEELIKIGAMEIIKLNGGYLTAGFIDTQVNGGGGILFNDDPSLETILKIRDAHKKFGTTHLLPTLISDDLSKVSKAIAAVKNAIENQEAGILGIHLEGPFLNPEKKGIHDANKFKILNDEAIEILSALKIAPSLITIAPEQHSIEMLAKLDEKPWVIMAAGHSNANANTMVKAAENGLRGVTHLFNAMSQLTAREPGIVGFALGSKSLYCGIIVDLVHVEAFNVRLAYDVLGAKNLMLVTDSMSTIGTDNKDFMLYGKKISVRDGSCFDENNTLAGSALDMASAVRNAHFKVGIPLGHAFEMASETPARFLYMGDKIGSIRIGLEANLIHLDDELNFKASI